MGKTIKKPDADHRGPSGNTGQGTVVSIPRQSDALTPEQQVRIKALNEIFRKKQEDYDKLSDEGKRLVEEDWERFKKSMNETHSGYRIPYPD